MIRAIAGHETGGVLRNLGDGSTIVIIEMILSPVLA
jgi:hypothetical protein